MKKYITVCLMAFTMLFQFSGFAQQSTLEQDEKEIDEIIDKVLKPTIEKWALLATQKTVEESIILVCKFGSIGFAYDEVLNKNIPSHNDLKEMFIKKLLPNYTKTGEALNTIYDKYLMKEVETFVEYSEAVPKYGLKLITEHELADIYISPEKGDNPQDSGQSLEEGMDSNGVEKNTLLNRYGDVVGVDFAIYEKYLEENNLDAIVEMTNFYEKFDLENMEEYLVYFEAFKEIGEQMLGDGGGDDNSFDEIEGVDADIMEELKKLFGDIDWSSFNN